MWVVGAFTVQPFAIATAGASVAVSTFTGGSWHVRLGCPQLIGSFAAIWDDILLPLPEDVCRDHLEIVTRS